MSRATDNAEGLSIKRMARIQNLDDFGQRFISLTRGDIPEGLRWKALIGGTRNEPGGRNRPDKLIALLIVRA